MSLQFVLGPAQVDHRQVMVQQLVKALSTAQSNDQFFYLVPNHIKFDTEVDVLNRLAQAAGQDKLYAQTQVQVFSFTRLAWYLMKNEAAYQVPRLSAAGIDMLLYRILRAHADELRLFGGEVSQTGFITQLAKEINELQTANLAPEDVTQLALQAPAGDLQAKLHDLAIVYGDFVTATAGKYLKPADVLAELNNYLQHRDLSQMHVYLELAGFAQLPGQQQALITTMLERGAQVTISLMLDKAVTQKLPENGSLFYQTGRLYYRLFQYAQVRQIHVGMDIKVKTSRVTPGLAALDDYWRGQPQHASGYEPQNTDLQIFRTDNRQTELAQVARQIRQLVTTGNYHYQDFLVITRHLTNYQTMLAPIFQTQQVPYFVDLQRAMADHPLVELISALFDLDAKHYQYRDVMRVLKTELLLPVINGQVMSRQAYRQAVDLTENFILKSGYTGRRWLEKADWQYYQFTAGDAGVETDENVAISKQINLIHHFVAQIFPPFFKKLAKAADGRTAATDLFDFLTQHGVDQQLLAWRDQALDHQDVAAAAEPEQTWQTFCNMLDEFVTLLGSSAFKSEDFLALLQAGFEGASYSQIPSTLDQVLISESGMVQSQNRKIVFMIGATDLVMPDRIMTNDLLSDVDKSALKSAIDQLDGDHYLSDSAVIQLGDERCLNYLAFMNATERLYLSAPLKDDQETDLGLSNYVKQIQQHFKLPTRVYLSAPDPTVTAIKPFVGTKRRTITHVIQVYREVLTTNMDRNRVGAALRPAPVWVWLRRQLTNDPEFGALAQQLLAGLSYRNIPVPLKPESVKALYGNQIYTSISKLEEFYRNQYAYFLKYGLKLRERDVFELSAASTGEFFHAVLDGLVKAVRADHLSLGTLDDGQLDHYLGQITTEVLAQPQFMILSSSNRMAYLRQQLINTVSQIARAIRNQSQRSAAQPEQTELLFGNVGKEHGLKALDFQVDAQHSVHVRGKIDRLDQIQVADQRFLGIVDYKSSVHRFDFQEAYYGIAMQMLTYLDAVLRNEHTIVADPEAKVKLAGALYMHIQNPTLKPSDVKTGFEAAMLKANKYKGILLDDPTLLEKLDTDLQKQSGVSKIYPFRRKASGEYNHANTRTPSLVTEAQLTQLITHNQQLIINAAAAIFAGSLALNPVRLTDKTTALQYSPYLAIMQFDAMLSENNYHDLQPLTPSEVLAKIAAGGIQND
ncbi:PD-(D/E)XK nuclease family protein [Lactiplantibacillus sp. WILCCON 0030]|uniref:ATP-dependent helicase/deoxyribonuclease subunit B n=1 Tax=Lactiplantibacillus brownii TaxID=3069269 RepID=A0ABU1AAL4_9LACO|nr:PD-(D/E)XK nuclease family protein [Lactiplantibacillus brownii]MDQ7938027.1 PD-(D/E)XK nuclease family protein [Lactiplantibacillus brownii]